MELVVAAHLAAAQVRGSIDSGARRHRVKNAKGPYIEGSAENRFAGLRRLPFPDDIVENSRVRFMITGSPRSKVVRPFPNQQSPSWHSAMLLDAPLLRSPSIATAAR